MSEVEDARAWLRDCQDRLAYERGFFTASRNIKFFEDAVLAALSWVWDAQERAGLNEGSFGLRIWEMRGDIRVGDCVWMNGREIGRIVA